MSVDVNVIAVTDNADGTATWEFDQPGTLDGASTAGYQVRDAIGQQLDYDAISQIDGFTFVMDYNAGLPVLPFSTWDTTGSDTGIDWSPNTLPAQSGSF